MEGPINRRPMRLAAKGEQPTLEWARWVEKTLRRIIDEPPKRNRPITGGGDAPPFWTTIAPIPDSDPVAYGATFALGYFTYQSAPSADAADPYSSVVGYIVPTINGVAMDAPNPPVNPGDPIVEPLELPDVVSYIYLRIKTTAKGMPDFDITPSPVTIEAFDSPQESIHHVRFSPLSGEEEGDYYFLIAETESNGATPPAPRIKRRITGNRSLPNQLIEIENIGGERELYRGYMVGPDDKHQIRTLEQLEGDGEPILKQLDPGDAEADPPVPAEGEGDTIPFRRIAERASSPQVQVKDGGDVIRVEGNGQDDTYSDPFGGSISFVDGLMTGVVPSGFEGDNFNIKLLNVSVVETSGETYVSDIGWGSAERFFYVRNGLIRLTDDMENVDTYEVISRIEGETFAGDGTNQSGDGFTEAEPPP